MTQSELNTFLAQLYMQLFSEVRNGNIIGDDSLCMTTKEYNDICRKFLTTAQREKQFTNRLKMSVKEYRTKYIDVVIKYWINQGFVYRNPTSGMCLLTSKGSVGGIR